MNNYKIDNSNQPKKNNSNKKNSELWLILNIALIVLGIGIAVYFIVFYERNEKNVQKPEYYEPHVDEPEVFNDLFTVDNLYGLWVDDADEFFRYNEDGTGVNWDMKDDVEEDEGTHLEWELKEDQFVMTFKFEEGSSVVPKMYTMKVLEPDTLIYEDDLDHKIYSFSKVIELKMLP